MKTIVLIILYVLIISIAISVLYTSKSASANALSTPFLQNISRQQFSDNTSRQSSLRSIKDDVVSLVDRSVKVVKEGVKEITYILFPNTSSELVSASGENFGV